MSKEESKSSSLKDIIAEAKKEVSATKISKQPTPSPLEVPTPVIKNELSDESLVKNIDDYDKTEWVNLRTSYANKLYYLLVGQIIGLFVLIISIGADWLDLTDRTLELTIVAVLLQTFFLVKIIVTNLFKKNSD